MRIATIVARLIVGAGFLFAGGSTFFMNPPPEPGLAGVFDDAFYGSHWASIFVFALWLLVAIKYRALFAPIFVASPAISDRSHDGAGIARS